jgi:sulfite reductase alpha subunit-like flavoprotein
MCITVASPRSPSLFSPAATLYSPTMDSPTVISPTMISHHTTFSPTSVGQNKINQRPKRSSVLNRATSYSESKAQEVAQLSQRRLFETKLSQRCFFANVELQEMIQKVKWLHARKYTIASHRRGSFDLIVKKVDQGFCTGFLYNMPLGGRLHATFTSVDDYKDRGGPINVVGAGSGASLAACFLSSWEEGDFATTYTGRKIAGDLRVYLGFCGVDHIPISDHFSKAVHAGIVTLGFSRSPVHPKIYVQDLMWEDKDAITEKLQHPDSVFYVCGGHGMVRGVKIALERLIGEQALADMEQQGRYVREIFGSE